MDTRNDLFKVDPLTTAILDYEHKMELIDQRSASFKVSFINSLNTLMKLCSTLKKIMNNNFNYIYFVKEHAERFVRFFKGNPDVSITFMITQYHQVLKTMKQQFNKFVSEEELRNKMNMLDIKETAIDNYCNINGLDPNLLNQKLSIDNVKEAVYTHCHVGLLTGNKKVFGLLREFLGIEKDKKFMLGTEAFKSTFCQIYDFQGNDNKYFNIINLYIARVFQQFEIYNRNINVIYNSEYKYTPMGENSTRNTRVNGKNNKNNSENNTNIPFEHIML